MTLDHQVLQIRAIQEALARNGLLHGDFDDGHLDVPTFNALLAWDAMNAKTRSSTESVDFPGFVSDLISGVFDAQVDTSVKQMAAYAELLRGANPGPRRTAA